ncbi:MAG TPA: 30S ribosomal protein S17 [Planctomycetota bacterium]
MSDNAPDETADSGRNARKVLRGVVTSAKPDKTVVVQVDQTTMHKRYRKVIRVRHKYYAHDEANTAAVGDKIEIMAARPMSKLKRWRVTQVLVKAR